ncbi:MAG TPA: hypothetical protein VM425_04150 [Myxococcota bacterium]|nr:hypothetical protein [Myxococcota bacterium]
MMCRARYKSLALSRWSSLLLLAVLLLESGCPYTILKMQPPPLKDPGIVCPVNVVVAMKRPSSADQTSPDQCKCEQQPAEKFAGKMESWRDGQIRLKLEERESIAKYSGTVLIMVDRVESVEIKKSFGWPFWVSVLGGVVLGGGVFAFSFYAWLNSIDW